MTKIKAPFNFVPLSEKVFFPDWADEISQDIPFSDGVSGKVKLTITAESPIFIRNAKTRDQEKKDEENRKKGIAPEYDFCHTDNGVYFIPATSIKGALRNVLEVISFCKMGKNLVQNRSFGIRDLSNGSDGIFYRSKVKTNNIHCGFLRMDKDGYVLEDHGLPWRISAEELDREFNLDNKFVKFISNPNNFKNTKENEGNRTARKKYDLFKNWNCNLEGKRFASDDKTREKLKVGGRLFVKFNSNGDKGTIVFTGQSGLRERNMRKRKKDGTFSMTGKGFEFVFPDEKTSQNILFNADATVMKDFLSIHKESPDFKDFHKEHLEAGESIPVFFMYDEEGEVDSMGLAYMYKYPAYNTIYDGIPDELQSTKHDLAECIFGYTSDNDSLKGRVQFSHAVLNGKPNFYAKQDVTLTSPHPSFYPLYLGNGCTWNSPEIRIAGRKRYPVRNIIANNNNKGTKGMNSEIHPLDKGSEFTCFVNFHNLKPAELGALLASIDFLGDKKCYHSLGYGKPLGYGKVKISYNLECDSSIDFVKIFEDTISQQINDWKNSVQLQELIMMARGIPDGREEEFSYLKMETETAKNEFKAAKNEYSEGGQLGLFSQIIGGTVPRNKNSVSEFAKSKRSDIEVKRSALNNIVSKYKQGANAESIYDDIKNYTKKYGVNQTLTQIFNNLEKSKVAAKDFEVAENAFKENRLGEAESLLKQYANNYKEPNLQVNEMLALIKEKRQEFEAIKTEAIEAKNAKNHALALEKFRQANSFGFEPLTAEIQSCKYFITVINADIQTFLKDINLPKMSIAAFAGRLKKRSSIPDDDIAVIAAKIKSEIPLMKQADQKKWNDFLRWGDIVKVVGETTAKSIFEKVVN